MGGKQGPAIDRHGAGNRRSLQATKHGVGAADAGGWPGVVVRKIQDLCVAVIGVIEPGIAVIEASMADGVVRVMTCVAADEVPVHQRLLAVRVQMREGQQPREHNGDSGHHRDEARGWVQRHGIRSMSARAPQSQTCGSGNQRIEVDVERGD